MADDDLAPDELAAFRDLRESARVLVAAQQAAKLAIAEAERSVTELLAAVDGPEVVEAAVISAAKERRAAGHAAGLRVNEASVDFRASLQRLVELIAPG